MKPQASCDTLLQNLKPNSRIANYHQISTRTSVITSHTWHKCIYLLVIVIFSVVLCTIIFFIKTYLILPFLILFRWLWTFCNQVIFKSTSKKFPSRTFHSSVVRITSCTSFLLLLSDPFEIFFCRVIRTSTKCALFVKSVCSFTIYIKTWSALQI